MLRLTSPTGILLLASVTALGPLAVDMYLPALPTIAEAFNVSSEQAQLTLSIYMVGFAAAQLYCGPVSDRFGRKPVLFAGLVIFGLASFACACAPNIETLMAARFFQALGGSAGPVLGRAAVRDVYEPHEGARVLSYMAGAMALAPAVAPMIGGAVLVSFGWGAIFFVLVIYAATIAAIVGIAMPEPLSMDHRQSIRFKAILRNYHLLISERRFLAHALTNASAWAGLFTFLSAAPFVLIDFFGVAPEAFGRYFVVVVAGFLLGTLGGARYGRRIDSERLIVVGAACCAAGGALMAALAICGVFTPLAVVVPQGLYMVGVGIIMPQTTAGALAPFPYFAGTGSSLFGFIQLTLGTALGTLVVQLADGTSRTMALAIAATGLLSFAGALWVRRDQLRGELTSAAAS